MGTNYKPHSDGVSVTPLCAPRHITLWRGYVCSGTRDMSHSDEPTKPGKGGGNMDLGLDGAVAVVTGGGTGIGAAAARSLAAEGAGVAVLGRRADRITAVAEEIDRMGGEALAVTCDVSDDAATRDAITAVVSHFGGIDTLHCSAGVSGLHGQSIEEISVGDWDRMMGVNVRGQWLAVKHALPHLRRSDRASVVIVASDSSFVATPGHVPYCTSKGAVLMLARALAVDLRSDGVRVNCVCPSIVDTEMVSADLGDGACTEMAAHGVPVQTAEEVASSMVYLASPRSRPVNGHALVSDFGYTAESSFPA
jgi:NAD(P)-dependent dehydrogenase (short-subunit alcohol dehydrogenase family)